MTSGSRQAQRKLKVILDSNALFVPLQFRIDIFEQLQTLLNVKFEPLVLSSVMKELGTIAEKSPPKMRKQALYALKLAEKCVVLDVKEETEGSPDDTIVEAARKLNCPVFTNDKKLRKKLRNINVPVIYVRQKSRLEIDGRI
jgi:rRNA-processing protein FCF1